MNVRSLAGPTIHGMGQEWLSRVDLRRPTVVPRMAGIGAELPIQLGAASGSSCPIPAVRNTRQDRLRRMKSSPSLTEAGAQVVGAGV
jgi:hypothetical protein